MDAKFGYSAKLKSAMMEEYIQSKQKSQLTGALLVALFGSLGLLYVNAMFAISEFIVLLLFYNVIGFGLELYMVHLLIALPLSYFMVDNHNGKIKAKAVNHLALLMM